MMNSKLFLFIGFICPLALIANQSQKNIIKNQLQKLALFYYDYYENFETNLNHNSSFCTHCNFLEASYGF